jgi:hypothetical protein
MGPEKIALSPLYVDGNPIFNRLRHLRGNGPPPDEIIELMLVRG